MDWKLVSIIKCNCFGRNIERKVVQNGVQNLNSYIYFSF